MTKEHASNLFKVLSDPNRLLILKRLIDGETCGCTLIDNLDISQPTLSYHLKTLSDSGLTKTKKEGTWKKHTVNTDLINELITFLIDLKSSEPGCKTK